MKKYTLFLFFIIFNSLSNAQQPIHAYIPADIQSVASVRWSVLSKKTPTSDWLQLRWVNYCLESLHISHWNNRSWAEMQNVFINPTIAGIDTAGFWHLASARDSLGVAHYMLVMPIRSMPTWKSFIEQSLARFIQSEFKIQNSHFYIQRENAAWVWNRDRIMIWWYLLPDGVQYKPTFVQRKAFADAYLTALLKMPISRGLHNDNNFNQSLTQPADFYWWTNWGDSLTSAMQFLFSPNSVRIQHQLSLSPATAAMLDKAPALDNKILSVALNKSHNGLQWIQRFDPHTEHSLAEVAKWLLHSPYWSGGNIKIDSVILQSPAIRKAWAALQGVVVGRLTHFISQADSSILPAFDIDIAHHNFKHLQAGLIELSNKNLITTTDKNKTLFEYKFSATWVWKIALQKKWLQISMGDADASTMTGGKLSDLHQTYFTNNLQAVVLDGNLFFTNWSRALPAQHRHQLWLHALMLNIQTYTLQSQKIENKQLIQQWDLEFVSKQTAVWNLFIQLGNLFVPTPSK